MRVFVCDYVTGGGMRGNARPPGLRRQDDAMLTALVKDLAEVPDTEVVVARDSGLPPADLPARIEVIEPTTAVWSAWSQILSDADALWPIAPESERALEGLSRLALEQGRILLGTGPEQVRLTASKWSTANHLAAHGVPVVSTWPSVRLPPSKHGWVVKPDDGSGCEGVRHFRDEADFRDWLGAFGGTRVYVVQPFVQGEALSLSVLCQNGAARVLSCNTQTVVTDHAGFRYLGGVVGGRSDGHEALERIAAQVAAAIPGLWGYVGIDLIDTRTGPLVLEVNPRLTTSYVGLRRALSVNPAALVLDLQRGRTLDGIKLDERVPVEISFANGNG